MNSKDVLKKATQILRAADISEPNASAEVLLADVLNTSRTSLLVNPEQELTPTEIRIFNKYIKRRLSHEPVWQIIGEVDFWGMSYQVDKNVLVPRPETEILVQAVLDQIPNTKYQIPKKDSNPKSKICEILDLGTGSGTIIIALAKELTDSSSKYFIPNTLYNLYASDISPKALKIAKKNATNLLRSRQVVFKQGDLMEPWKGKKFDVIVANLPYIPHEDMDSLAFDVFHHEPRLALDGGKEGLEIYERFFSDVIGYLEPKGAIFCEIGINQGMLIKNLAQKYLPVATVKVQGDLAGIDRIAIIRL